MSALTTSDFLESVFKKAGIDTTEDAIRDLLQNKTIESIPAELASRVNENTYSLEGAKNAPEVFNAVKASTYLKLERMGKKLYPLIDSEGDFKAFLDDFRGKNEKSNVVDAYDHLFDVLSDKVKDLSKGGDGKDPNAGKYAEQLAQMKEALDVKDNDIKALNLAHNEALQLKEQEFQNQRIDWASKEILNSLPLDKNVVRSPEVRAAIYDGAIRGAREKFVIKLDENGRPAPFLKENPELRATGGNKEPLSMSDVYVDLVKPYLDPSNGKGDGGNGDGKGNGNGKSKQFTPNPKGQTRANWM